MSSTDGDTGTRSSSQPRTSPTPARKEGNDSLWKRARRTLGTQNLGFLQPQARPPGASTSGPPAPNKRREQVRQAQRTHRQRTQNYIKTLESEVVRLRESEGKLRVRHDALVTSVEILKNTLISHDLPIPAGLPHDRPSSVHSSTSVPPSRSPYDFNAQVSYGADELDHQRLRVSWPDIPEQGPVPAYSQVPSQAQPQFGTSQAYAEQSWVTSDEKPLPDLPNDFSLQALTTTAGADESIPAVRSPVAAQRPAHGTADLRTLETAIDFVLALEHPCMAHIPYPAEPGGLEPTNHTMLASAPLMAQAPRNPTQHGDMMWSASASAIQQLLSLSKGINLEGEITPIEAWNLLQAHPSFQRLGKAGVDKLKWQLSQHVRCEGFGAVLDEVVFWYYFNDINDQLPPATLTF